MNDRQGSQDLRTAPECEYEESATAVQETRPGERAWAAENVGKSTAPPQWRGRAETSANLLVRVVAAGTFHRIRHHLRRLVAGAAARLIHHLLAATMAGHAALAAGLTCFLAGPLVGRALLMRSLAALACDLALLGAVHRGESAILFSHTFLPDSLASPPHTPARRTPVPFQASRRAAASRAHPRLRLQRMCHGSGVTVDNRHPCIDLPGGQRDVCGWHASAACQRAAGFR